MKARVERRRRGLWQAACGMIVALGAIVIVVVQGGPEDSFARNAAGFSGSGHEPDLASAAADLEFYRQNIEPLFVRPRGGSSPGYAACVMCHTWQTSIRFSLEDMTEEGGNVFWTAEQSAENYDVVTQLVNASRPEESRLLLKPLATSAGGLVHTGGDYWESTSDPEYQLILDWIRMLPAERYTPPPEPVADFEFFRTCVQPLFHVGRPGQIACHNCHGGGLAGFAPMPAGGTAWNDEEARAAYEVISRLIIPGNPEESRFLLKPLHPDGGGSYTHNGPRRWQSTDDPEYQMIAAWVRGERAGNVCSQ